MPNAHFQPTPRKFRAPRGVACSHASTTFRSCYLASDGSTLSGDDSSHRSDGNASMGGFSDGQGGAEDAMAPEKQQCNDDDPGQSSCRDHRRWKPC
eukprot:355572-Chlamydomonas_euryale.AAC.1